MYVNWIKFVSFIAGHEGEFGDYRLLYARNDRIRASKEN